MQATRTHPATNPRHQGRQPPPAPPAGPGTQILTVRSEEEFFSRFGDAIDDRIAEILDELQHQKIVTLP